MFDKFAGLFDLNNDRSAAIAVRAAGLGFVDEIIDDDEYDDEDEVDDYEDGDDKCDEDDDEDEW